MSHQRGVTDKISGIFIQILIFIDPDAILILSPPNTFIFTIHNWTLLMLDEMDDLIGLFAVHLKCLFSIKFNG